jgi:hypothetical protein
MPILKDSRSSPVRYLVDSIDATGAEIAAFFLRGPERMSGFNPSLRGDVPDPFGASLRSVDSNY